MSSRIGVAISSALQAFNNPMRQGSEFKAISMDGCFKLNSTCLIFYVLFCVCWISDMVAALGETTGNFSLMLMRDKMLKHATGRRILRDRPLVNTKTINLDQLRNQAPGTFGKEYVNWLDKFSVSPDQRVEVMIWRKRKEKKEKKKVTSS